MNEKFRVIPGYEGYCVSKDGVVMSLVRDLVLRQYLLNGYLIVDTFRGALTETLPVHRAVALAWVNNPNPESFTVVNHRDGNPMNNEWKNLEWTTYSGNNYHAVNFGLRNDNIPCKVRNFITKNVHEFSSMAQASEFMGLPKDAPIERLYPKMFGKLIRACYEFRFADDPTPWFYETRSKIIAPSRYMVIVTEPDGSTKEIYSNREMLRQYQLYDSPGKSIPALAQYASQIYPDKRFNVRDSYVEKQFRLRRNTKASIAQPIRANRCDEQMTFESLTKCANYFQVDRSSILNRLDNGKELDGWTFAQLPL